MKSVSEAVRVVVTVVGIAKRVSLDVFPPELPMLLVGLDEVRQSQLRELKSSAAVSTALRRDLQTL